MGSHIDDHPMPQIDGCHLMVHNQNTGQGMPQGWVIHAFQIIRAFKIFRTI